MKKLLLVPALFLLGLILLSKPALAQSCEFTRDSNFDLIVQVGHECPDTHIATPTTVTSIYEVPLCTCVPVEEGVNCQIEGLAPVSGQNCCPNLIQNSSSGICISSGVDPYHNCYWSNPPAEATCCGSYTNDGNGNCVWSFGAGKNDPTEGCAGNEINTAIGCIPVSNSGDFVSFILNWAIGVGGGIAFLLIILASFMIMTSAGNPDRQKAGQELLTSAIAGLIMLIFSVFILKLIGVDILKLPGII